MRRTRRSLKRSTSPDSSDDEPLIKKVSKHDTIKKKTPVEKSKPEEGENSSSDSDIADYLQDPNKLDLNSTFFQGASKSPQSFDNIEKSIFDGVTRLSDSESDSDDENLTKSNAISNRLSQPDEITNKTSQNDSEESHPVSKLNFQQLQNYTKKIEEAKKHVEKYKKQKALVKNKKHVEELNISDILSAEKNELNQSLKAESSTFHSSDFESCSDSEKDWEEVDNNEKQAIEAKPDIPKDGVQITIELPQAIRKTKSVDLLTVMKRKLNRMRKENQIYIHKVHLLCWIAHGNFVNSVINNDKILGLSLSLLPSQNSYPSGRIDLGYLEQLLQWYKKTVLLVEKPVPKNSSLLKMLEKQISIKQVHNKKMLTYIFIALLRGLGIQCRLVLSFVLEPLRPPASELHSLSTKQEDVKKEKETKSSKNTNTNHITNEEKPRSKDKSDTTAKKSIDNKEKHSTNKSRQPDKRASVKLKTEKDETPVQPKRAKKNDEAVTTRPVNKKSVKQGTQSKATSKSKSTKDVDTHKENMLTGKTTKHVDKNVPPMNKQNEKTSNTISKKEVESNKEKKLGNKVKAVEDNQLPSNQQADKGKTKLDIKRTKQNDLSPPTRVTRGRSNTPILDEISKSSGGSKTSTKTKKLTNQEASKTADVKQEIQVKPKDIKNKKNIKQIDGLFDSSDSENSSSESLFDDFFSLNVSQLDGTDDAKKSSSKPNLKNIKKKINENNNSENQAKVSNENKRNSNANVNKKLPAKESKVNLQKLSSKPVQSRTSKSPIKSKVSEVDSEEEFTSHLKHKANSPNVNAKPSTSKNTCKYFNSPMSAGDIRGDIMQLVMGRMGQEKEKRNSKRIKPAKQKYDVDSDSDYEPDPRGKKQVDSEDEFVPKTKVKRRIPVRKVGSSLKVLSSDEENDKSKKKRGVDAWAEVFLEDEEKWISVDVVRGEMHCVQQLYARATPPVSYIVAWNNDNSLKDITVRYCNNFNTTTRKLRVDKKWWNESLAPFIGKKTARDKEEDEELARQQLDKPLPTSIAEYKNHPLYVLKRHLLKFEGIYPSDAPTLGFVRSEPVYSRDCVYTLHSRDIWLKHAKVVKPGEKPYKIVKARPKYDKLSNTVITDQMLEVFGPWQTQDYDPPTAENGIVPRNAYGNVELFKPCMLPKKTVHLQLPGLNKTARKLNIDCAAAIVGFDFHSGWSHPTYDGFVVCEEYADQLVAAWELEQEEMEVKEQEKIEKRVYDNWKRLIKGLLIRERLKARYDFSAGPSKKQKKASNAPKLSIKKKRRISDSD